MRVGSQGVGACVAAQLVRAEPSLDGHVTLDADGRGAAIGGDADLAGALLELRPASISEVPVWLGIKDGHVNLADVDFLPASVSLVRWGARHQERGLIVDFPQVLLNPAIAGTDRRAPVAGGRRADGALELWIAASPNGDVLATVDVAAALGSFADIQWTSGAGDEGRLLVALAPAPGDRRLGLASLPLVPADGLGRLEAVLLSSLSAAQPDEDLLRHSEAAARSTACRRLWQEIGA